MSDVFQSSDDDFRFTFPDDGAEGAEGVDALLVEESPSPLGPVVPVDLPLDPVGPVTVVAPVQELLPPEVEEGPMPWSRYIPPRDASNPNVILVDPYEEARQGLVPMDFPDRLRQNGCADRALDTIMAIMQDPAASKKVRADAAIKVLEMAHGTAKAAERSTQVQVLVQVDL